MAIEFWFKGQRSTPLSDLRIEPKRTMVRVRGALWPRRATRAAVALHTNRIVLLPVDDKGRVVVRGQSKGLTPLAPIDPTGCYMAHQKHARVYIQCQGFLLANELPAGVWRLDEERDGMLFFAYAGPGDDGQDEDDEGIESPLPGA